MGTWGTGLYANDTACDVRDTWLDKLRLGTPAVEATAELLKEMSGGDDDDDPLLWLALADTQWTWGRLEDHVRERAEGVLAAGGDLTLWEKSKKRAARARVFEKLAARLKQAPPAPKTIRVRSDAVAWKRGQLWAYRTLDGKYVVFRVAAFDPTCGLVGAPVTELLDVVLDEIPPSESLAHMGVRPARPGYNESGLYDFLAPEHRGSPMFEPKVKRRGERPRHRLKKLAAEGDPRPASATTLTMGVPWDGMDQFLSNDFDIGGPRLGAVHRWSLANGDNAYTVVEWMEWPETLIETQWKLGVLDCRGENLDAPALAAGRVLCSIIITGFPPAGVLHEVGYRPPSKVIGPISGAVHQWDALPRSLENIAELVAGRKAWNAFVAAARRKPPKS